VEVRAGDTIAHYHVFETLGEGGMGVVSKAEDTRLRRLVALKFLSDKTAVDAGARARFLREAQAGGALDHPNICRVHGFEEHEGRAFIVMAFVEGESQVAGQAGATRDPARTLHANGSMAPAASPSNAAMRVRCGEGAKFGRNTDERIE
jgi:hypothetical protein